MRLITSTDDLANACADLATHDFVAVDTEFMRESTFWPELCLIQLAAPGIELMVDPMAKGLDLKPFWGLMADERVVKVFHAARQDIEIVYTEAGHVPRPCSTPRSRPWSAASARASATSIWSSASRARTSTSHRASPTGAGVRFSEKQLIYALGDVTHLRDVYRHLASELDKSGRASWLDEEMADTHRPRAPTSSHLRSSWQRLKLRVKNRKALAVLMELAAWRETPGAGAGRAAPAHPAR